MKSKSEIIKQAIEKSIIKLDEGINLNEEKINYAQYEIKELKKLLSDDKNLFQEYRQRIKDILNQGTENIKEKIKELVSFIRLGDKEIKIALSSVNRKGLVSMLFASAPSGEQYTNIKIYRVRDKIPLPSKLLLKNKSHLYRLYVKQKLSKREIARILNVNHSSVIERLREFGIYRPEENPNKKNNSKDKYLMAMITKIINL